MTASVQARPARIRGARGLFTGRGGGISTGGFSSLNLARHVGDEDEAVTRNRELVTAEVGVPLAFVDQVHSADVHVLPRSGPAPVVRADAVVTDRGDVAPAIMVADCLPVLLADPEAGVVAAAHAGRRGLLEGILPATVEAMASLGAQPSRLQVAVGPSVCGRCYEVPGAMREESVARLPQVWAETSWGTPALDLRAGAAAQLEQAGIPVAAVDLEHPCTLEDPGCFSYRRDAATGRSVGVIRTEPR